MPSYGIRHIILSDLQKASEKIREGAYGQTFWGVTQAPFYDLLVTLLDHCARPDGTLLCQSWLSCVSGRHRSRHHLADLESLQSRDYGRVYRDSAEEQDAVCLGLNL